MQYWIVMVFKQWLV